MSHNSIVEDIRSSPERRKKAVQVLLHDEQFFYKLNKYILNNSGSKDEAKMIFHDTIVAFIKYVFKNRDFKLSANVQSYLMGMAKNLWITELRKKSRRPQFADLSESMEERDEEPISSELLLKGEKSQIIEDVLQQLRKRCKEVLMYWANGYKMKEIAEMLKYKSEGMVRKKKSECMKAFYEYLAANPQIKNQLKSY